MKNKNSIFFLFAFVFLLIFGSFILLFLTTSQNAVLAQYGLEKAGEITGIAKGTIPEYVGKIIKTVIEILGVILVALIIYGGIVYATSAGNEEQITTGKNILTYAIIGVTICALAFALTDYVLRALFVGESRESGGTTSPSQGGTPASPSQLQNPNELQYRYGRLCGMQGAECFYDYNCCTEYGYKCDNKRCVRKK